jgi:RimJ/RimL family protein N-acetyltransferase
VTGTWREPYETERLRLRPLALSDGDALHPLQRDGEMMRYFGGPYRRQQTDSWLQWHVAMWEQEGYSHWAAELKEEGVFVGWIGLTKVWEPEEILPAVEVGWFVDRRYWGRGLAPEGGRRSLAFGFEDLGLDRVIARYDPNNVASGKVMEKIGMRHLRDMPRSNPEGISRIYEIQADKKPHITA